MGCEWLLTSCYFYPGSKWFIGREELKRLKDTTLLTFFKVCAYHKIPKEDWAFNGQGNYIEFKNGSRIDLLDLKDLPGDPLYERYGSSEYTSGWIEEGGEVSFNAFDTLKSRIGRWRNTEFGVKAKMLITCNPKKNWLYTTFYKPWKENTLPQGYAIVFSLVGDNTYNESTYRQQLLEITDEAKKQRLLYGNWEYEDDPSTLIKFDAIQDLFTNTVSENGKYLSVDVARHGKDRTVAIVWHGLWAKRIIVWEKQDTFTTAGKLKELASEEFIPRSHFIIDEDGIGGGVLDQLPGAKGFIANSTPLERVGGQIDNYANLKAQCSYKLAQVANERLMRIDCPDQRAKEMLVQELEQIKSKDMDKDGKLKIMPKDEVKDLIGRSPDFSDALMMRMIFELQPESVTRPITTFYPNSKPYGSRTNTIPSIASKP